MSKEHQNKVEKERLYEKTKYIRHSSPKSVDSSYISHLQTEADRDKI